MDGGKCFSIVFIITVLFGLLCFNLDTVLATLYFVPFSIYLTAFLKLDYNKWRL